MQNSNPTGFISVDEAVKLIQSDTRTEAKVDTSYLITHLIWVEKGHNFTIPLMKTVARGDHRRNGNVYIYVATDFEAELIKKTIRDHYRDMVGREYDEESGRHITTTITDKGNADGRPMANDAEDELSGARTKVGEDIGSTVLNGGEDA